MSLKLSECSQLKQDLINELHSSNDNSLLILCTRLVILAHLQHERAAGCAEPKHAVPLLPFADGRNAANVRALE